MVRKRPCVRFTLWAPESTYIYEQIFFFKNVKLKKRQRFLRIFQRNTFSFIDLDRNMTKNNIFFNYKLRYDPLDQNINNKFEVNND